ncbi:hypothetical protein LINPERHAP1_LOCUS9816 [Linum perenne]
MDGFPVREVWVAFVPTKITSFVWQVFYKSISTFENLQKRGFIGPSVCVLCRADLESVSHLLLSCSFSSWIWLTFSSKLAIWGPAHSDVSNFIREWQVRNSRFQSFKVGLMHVLFWCIWGERNDRIFRDRVRTREQLVWKIAVTICRWLRVANIITRDEMKDWLELWRLHFDPG